MNETLLVIFNPLFSGHVVQWPRPKSEFESFKVFPSCLYVSAYSLFSERRHSSSAWYAVSFL